MIMKKTLFVYSLVSQTSPHFGIGQAGAWSNESQGVSGQGI